MIELSRHIESLLLKHDCVIVPGLGGFVTQHVSARHVADECLFLPPYRSVSFNSQLTHNDGLLVQSYMQAYDTTFPEAVRIIDEAVLKLKQCLASNGEYELNGIGHLYLESDGRYRFAPCEAGVISPELYGLDSFTLHEIVQNKQPKKAKKKIVHRLSNPFRRIKPIVKQSNNSYTLRINREVVNCVAAAIVTLIFYIAWPTSLSNNSASNTQSATMAYEHMFGSVLSQTEETKAKPETEISDAKAKPIETIHPAKNKAIVDDTKHTENNAENVAEYANFSIVMASSVTMKNAKNFAAELSKEGYPQARAFHKGKMVRVLIGSYASKEDAQKALRTYRSNKLFSTAWVIALH